MATAELLRINWMRNLCKEHRGVGSDRKRHAKLVQQVAMQFQITDSRTERLKLSLW
jgi:hypothetical protein